MKNTIVDDLFKKYISFHFPMGSGSPEWRDLKVEFEVIDDFIAGSDSKNYSSIEKNIFENFSNRLKKLNDDVTMYAPKDLIEEEEKVTVKGKIDCGLLITQEISKLI